MILLFRPLLPVVLHAGNKHFFSTASMNSKLMKELAYVDGAWVKALSGKTFDVLSPTTAEKIASVPDMDDKDTERAIDAAAKVKILYDLSTLQACNKLQLIAC